ncbi:hypothetical protein MRY87_05485 [bacterium]|nr:hypothetical protein [bacterium]
MNSPTRFRRGLYLLVALVVMGVSGCGRYGPPLPPEAYAPAAVQQLVVSASVEGVQFQWQSPNDDRRGLELRDLAYYDIRRVETDDLAAFLEEPIEESELVGRVYDRSTLILEEKRRQARQKKLPARKVRLESALRTHHFLDSSARPGSTYLYLVVPVTERGTAGEVLQYVRVVFSGTSSQVSFLESSAFEKPYLLRF